MKTTLIGLLALGVLLAGCAAQRNVRVVPLFANDPYWSQVAPKQVSAVIITEGDLRREYKQIAKISVDYSGDKKEEAFARMKEAAAKIGADAVIKIKMSKPPAGKEAERQTFAGLAVVFKTVGLTKIPTIGPVIKTVTVPGPSRPLPGGGTGGGIGGGNPIDPTGGGGTTPIVEIPPENEDIGTNFNGNQVEDRDMFFAQMVHFQSDSSKVQRDDLPKVRIVAQHMIQTPSHALVIEGHCDECGTEDYNLSLGERRALAVVDELINLGVPAARIRTISYGDKIHIAIGTSEAILAQNRRGEFVLLSPAR